MDEGNILQRMKVLIIQETDWLNRGPHQQHHLAEMLSLREHEIRVIDYEFMWRTQDKREVRSRREIFNNVSKVRDGVRITVVRPGIIKIPWLDYMSLVFSHKKEIDRQIREFSPDVIIGFGILNSYIAKRAAKRGGIPFVYYWIDVLHLLVPSKILQPVARIITELTLKNADCVLTINEALKERVLRMGAPLERTYVIRAGIDIGRFSLSTDDSTIRKQHGLSEQDVVLFFMGWLYNFSGIKEVALQLVDGENFNIKLLVVGDGDAYKELQKIRERYELQDRLILVGKKPYQEIPSFIAAADICLLPAYPTEKIMQDIVPIKIYEYMAMGKPVISTKLPGVMMEFGEDSGVIYVDKPEDVVGRAIELINTGKVNELSSKARNFVRRSSWDSITDEFEKVLEESIKEKQHGTIY